VVCGGAADRGGPFGVAGLGERHRLAGTTSSSPSTPCVPSVHIGRNPASLDLDYFPVMIFCGACARLTVFTHKRCAWHCCGACAGLARRGCVRCVPREHMV
jgi:hypothetical protein